MKLIFAVLDVSLTMGLTRCYKTEGFLHLLHLYLLFLFLTITKLRAYNVPLTHLAHGFHTHKRCY